MLIGTIVTGVGVVTTITLQYCPEYIHWVNATVPQAIRVIVAGDGVICDLDAAGIDGINRQYFAGTVANGYSVRLANGVVTNKVTQIIVTNGVAANINLFGFSTGKGSQYLQSLQQAAVAPSGATFQNFMYLSLANAVTATDIINVEFTDGTVQQFDALEARMINAFWQNNVAATVCGFNNSSGGIKRLQFTPAVTQNVYLQRWAMVGNVSQSAM